MKLKISAHSGPTHMGWYMSVTCDCKYNKNCEKTNSSSRKRYKDAYFYAIFVMERLQKRN